MEVLLLTEELLLLDRELQEGDIVAVNVVLLLDLKEANEAAIGRLLEGDQAVAITDF